MGKIITEVWKPVNDYEGLYEISSFGSVKSKDRKVFASNQYGAKAYRTIKGKMLKPRKDKDGYYRVVFSENGKIKNYFVHRLVAEAFIPDKSNFKSMPDEDRSMINLDDLLINHKNEIKSCNVVSNLEWCTAKYNMFYEEGNAKRGVKRRKPIFQ